MSNIRPFLFVVGKVIHIANCNALASSRGGFYGCVCGEYLRGDSLFAFKSISGFSACPKCFLYFVPVS